MAVNQLYDGQHWGEPACDLHFKWLGLLECYRSHPGPKITPWQTAERARHVGSHPGLIGVLSQPVGEFKRVFLKKVCSLLAVATAAPQFRAISEVVNSQTGGTCNINLCICICVCIYICIYNRFKREIAMLHFFWCTLYEEEKNILQKNLLNYMIP